MATPTPDQFAAFDSLLSSGDYAAAATMAQSNGYNPQQVTAYISDKFGADKGQKATQWYSDTAGLTKNSNSIIGGANSYSLPSSYSYNSQPQQTAPAQQPEQQPWQQHEGRYLVGPAQQNTTYEQGGPYMQSGVNPAYSSGPWNGYQGGMGQMGMGYSPYGNNPYQSNPYMMGGIGMMGGMGGGFGGFNNYGMSSGFGGGFQQYQPTYAPQSQGGQMMNQMAQQQRMQNPNGRVRAGLLG